MHLSDRLEPAAALQGIITRSDRVPTACERYGDWARKFFGYGYHQACEGPATAPVRMASDAPLRH